MNRSPTVLNQSIAFLVSAGCSILNSQSCNHFRLRQTATVVWFREMAAIWLSAFIDRFLQQQHGRFGLPPSILSIRPIGPESAEFASEHVVQFGHEQQMDHSVHAEAAVAADLRVCVEPAAAQHGDRLHDGEHGVDEMVTAMIRNWNSSSTSRRASFWLSSRSLIPFL